MNQQLKEAKRIIRSYWPQWSDAALADAYAAAQDGKMPWSEDGCLVDRSRIKGLSRYSANMPGGVNRLSDAYLCLVISEDIRPEDEHLRQKRIVPMLKAEMKRRELR